MEINSIISKIVRVTVKNSIGFERGKSRAKMNACIFPLAIPISSRDRITIDLRRESV